MSTENCCLHQSSYITNITNITNTYDIIFLIDVNFNSSVLFVDSRYSIPGRLVTRSFSFS